MIARIQASLPVPLVVPADEVLTPITYREGRYTVTIHPPFQDAASGGIDPSLQIIMNEKPAVQANALRIDFIKRTFNRREGADWDLPLEMILQSLNSFLRRFRQVARAANFPTTVTPGPGINLRLTYLGEDENKVPRRKGLITGRGTVSMRMSSGPALSAATWKQVASLPTDFAPQNWEPFLLDAAAQAEEPGTAIMLAAIALEVFIARILDLLAAGTAGLPIGLWKWMTDKPDARSKEPSVDEQFDFLLKALCGHSLKEDQRLWRDYKTIRNARNNFVHRGVAANGMQVLNPARAAELVKSATDITCTIREWLPEKLRWPIFRHTDTVKMYKDFLVANNSAKVVDLQIRQHS